MTHIASGHLARVRQMFQSYLDIVEANDLLQVKHPSAWVANGTFSVSITALGPAGITTATIGKWLSLVDNAGVVYFVPAWT